uniref:Uncharacterized protein n=1 Tax=Arundo donax TaxID=35708 RepID=A0A0A9DPW9_ARUDO
MHLFEQRSYYLLITNALCEHTIVNDITIIRFIVKIIHLRYLGPVWHSSRFDIHAGFEFVK